MRVSTASAAGDPTGANEDWAVATEGLIVVLDGATARTETGCSHGVAWYTATLGSSIAELAGDRAVNLGDALAYAIGVTAARHRDCDLDHPGTPSAASAIVRLNDGAFEYLVLGDVTVVIDTADGIQTITDDRVDHTATPERQDVHRHPFGSAERQAALLRMKHAELAARNQPGGYWVAAADATVATHAITAAVPRERVRRLAVLTDGAARLVTLFELLDWPGLLDLVDRSGPAEVIRRTRAVEAADPSATRWARNKCSDDATAVYAC